MWQYTRAGADGVPLARVETGDAPAEVDAIELRTAETTTAGAPPRGRSGARPPWLRPALIGAVSGAALVAAWLWISDAAQHEPIVETMIIPNPNEGIEVEELREASALAIFRDPDLRGAFLPGWLNAVFPQSNVAQLADATGPIGGASIYAAVSHDEIACIIVRLEPNGMDWNCTSVDRVVTGGMSLRTLIPSDLGSGTDDDQDGVSGELSRTDLLVVEWNEDGTFVVRRTPH